MTVALVTGASGYLGQAIAAALGGPDVHVVCHYRSNREGAEKAAAAVAERGGQATLVAADLARRDAPGTLLAACPEPPSVLVANAGATADNLSMLMSDDAFDRVLDANLGSAFRCARAVLKPMLRRRYGRIVFVGSVAGLLGNPGQANYAAAKAGLGGLARSLAREVASRNITVNVVAPGVLDGGLAANTPAGAVDHLVAAVPVGRAGRAEEVAAAVAFLTSDAAAYVTGATLAVDGGMSMGC